MLPTPPRDAPTASCHDDQWSDHPRPSVLQAPPPNPFILSLTCQGVVDQPHLAVRETEVVYGLSLKEKCGSRLSARLVCPQCVQLWHQKCCVQGRCLSIWGKLGQLVPMCCCHCPVTPSRRRSCESRIFNWHGFKIGRCNFPDESMSIKLFISSYFKS